MADADPIREFAEMVNASQAGVAFTVLQIVKE